MGKKKNPKYELVPVGDGSEPRIESTEEPEPADNKPPSRVGRTYTKWLRCELTDDESRQAAKRLAERMEDKERKEAELDSVKNQFKGEISRIDADITAAKNLVRDGYEMRDVQVEEVRDFDTETVTLTRMDTFETIEERRMRGEELQRPLPGME